MLGPHRMATAQVKRVQTPTQMFRNLRCHRLLHFATACNHELKGSVVPVIFDASVGELANADGIVLGDMWAKGVLNWWKNMYDICDGKMDPSFNTYDVHVSRQDNSLKDVRGKTEFDFNPIKSELFSRVPQILQENEFTEMDINDAMMEVYRNEIQHNELDHPGWPESQLIHIVDGLIAQVKTLLSQRNNFLASFLQSKQRDEDAFANYDLRQNNPDGRAFLYKRPPLAWEDNFFIEP